MGILVRVADDADLGVVAGMRRAWNEEDAGAPIEDDAFEASFRAWWNAERLSRTFLLVEVDGVAVGMANVKHYDRMPVAGRAGAGRWGYVGNVFVLAEYRDAGVGTLLMEELIAWAASSGMEHLRLAPSVRSGPFYERLGFHPGRVVQLDPPGPGHGAPSPTTQVPAPR